MYNKISIFFNGKPFFTTDPKSISTISDLIKVFNVLNRKFPNEEGYTIWVTFYIMTFNRNHWKTLIDLRNKLNAIFNEE